jgi:hypothetical protein
MKASFVYENLVVMVLRILDSSLHLDRVTVNDMTPLTQPNPTMLGNILSNSWSWFLLLRFHEGLSFVQPKF